MGRCTSVQPRRRTADESRLIARLKYSNRANTDLVGLYRFLATKDVAAAQNAIKEIRDALATLIHAPKIGHPVEEGFRECIIDFGSSGHLGLYDFVEVHDEVVVHAERH